jgi:membrane protein implicated in regulation of membrane protease activity
MPDVYSWFALAIAALAFVLGVQVLGVTGAIAAIVVAVIGLTVAAWAGGRQVRRRLERHDPRFQPTQEVFRESRHGRTMRVYTDPATGERRYWPDD